VTTARGLGAILGVTLAALPAVTAAQSLYREGGPGVYLFADNRARGVNDIVTVVIAEQSSTSRAASTKSAQDTSRTAGVTQFPTIFDPIAKKYLTGIQKTITGNGQTPSQLAEQRFNLNMATSGSHQGSANIDREDRVTGQIAARVVRVLDGGNLLIEGRRAVLVNNDTQIITLSGIIRPQDITSTNTILSSQIADAEIQVEGQGVTSEAQNPGLFYRLLDWLGVF